MTSLRRGSRRPLSPSTLRNFERFTVNMDVKTCDNSLIPPLSLHPITHALTYSIFLRSTSSFPSLHQSSLRADQLSNVRVRIRYRVQTSFVRFLLRREDSSRRVENCLKTVRKKKREREREREKVECEMNARLDNTGAKILNTKRM